MPAELSLIDQFRMIRKLTEKIVSPLVPEDFTIQSADFVSPPKWHLAHTTWFYENFILRDFIPHYKVRNESYLKLFNSYYKSQGEHWQRCERGRLSRPTVSEIFDYRTQIDELMLGLFLKTDNPEAWKRLELGIHHEQQHQELLLMDIKHILSRSVDPTPYRDSHKNFHSEKPLSLKFQNYKDEIIEVGKNLDSTFAFDNETPRHKFYLHEFALAERPITNGEFLQFIDDGGYKNPLLWKSDGWDYLQSHKNHHPLYWRKKQGSWFEYNLDGELPLNPDQPVSHINFYEADAFATWAQVRLPTEFELESVYSKTKENLFSGFLESGSLKPSLFNQADSPFISLRGNLWEWTASSYVSYPKYKKPLGVFGEYNQKFMLNQMVLRGGCFATSRSHFRNTYRNFFYPHQNWAFTGLRLAKDI